MSTWNHKCERAHTEKRMRLFTIKLIRRCFCMGKHRGEHASASVYASSPNLRSLDEIRWSLFTGADFVFESKKRPSLMMSSRLSTLTVMTMLWRKPVLWPILHPIMKARLGAIQRLFFFILVLDLLRYNIPSHLYTDFVILKWCNHNPYKALLVTPAIV